MSETARIAEQLKRAVEGGAWHGPALLETVQGLTVAQASARPLPQAHSIWEIVDHTAGWADVIRRRVLGEAVTEPDAGDWPTASDTSEAAWAAAVETLRQNYAKLLDVVGSLDDEGLEALVPGSTSSVYVTLHGAIQHGLYHAGQIAVLRKAEVR